MSARPDPVRIDDLASPVFPDFVTELLASVEGTSVDLTVAAVQSTASEMSGLEPYEDAAYLERMEVLLSAMQADRGLSNFGRMNNFGIMARYAAQRARLEALYRAHPEIEAVEIEAPIVIAGLPRSGTTHLLNLISVDDRLRSLPYWESLEPFPLNAKPAELNPDDPRVIACREQLVVQDSIMPYFKNMHEMTPEHIHEEVELMGMDMSMMLFENYGLLHEWRRYYQSHDQTPHYEFLKRALKALQWLRGPNKWILKSPQHLEQLPALRQVFPDASYVVTHRDPVSVTASLLTMLSYSARLSRKPVCPKEIADYWVGRTEDMLQGCIRDMNVLPKEATRHILFHEFMKDDIATVADIYRQASHPFSDELEQAMKQYMIDNPRGKYGQVLYDLSGDFGLNTEALYGRFAFYTDHVPVRIER